MVCRRCKNIVKTELDKIGVRYISVEIGETVLKNDLTSEQFGLLDYALRKSGLELINQDKTVIVENLKTIIIELEHYSDEDLNTRYSDLISARLNICFTSLNTLFSEIEGITIEKYIIRHKIELIRQLLIGNKKMISEIAREMHYSTTAKMTSQFKSVTGLTPKHFKQLWFSNNHYPESN